MTPEQALAMGKLLKASGMDIDKTFAAMVAGRVTPILDWPILNRIRVLPGYRPAGQILKCAQLAIWMQEGHNDAR